jgi:thymidylate synthase (FAD)
MRIIQPEAHILPFNGDILKHVERCGRIAYKSEGAITECSYVRFIKNIIQRGHESVLEHANYVFALNIEDYMETIKLYNSLPFEMYKEEGYSARLRFSLYNKPIVSGNIRAWRDFIRVCMGELKSIPKWVHGQFHNNPAFADLCLLVQFNAYRYKELSREDLTPTEADIHWTETVHIICSRAISHEFVRHRALSPTQESQRYCNYSKGKFGGEVTFIQPLWAIPLTVRGMMWEDMMQTAENEYLGLLEVDLQPQEAREPLPNSTKTELVMTGTLGEWKHFFFLRCADDAHPEARRIAIPLRDEFTEKYAF